MSLASLLETEGVIRYLTYLTDLWDDNSVSHFYPPNGETEDEEETTNNKLSNIKIFVLNQMLNIVKATKKVCEASHKRVVKFLVEKSYFGDHAEAVKELAANKLFTYFDHLNKLKSEKG